MEETKRRRYIIRAVLEGEVDVHEEPVPPIPPGVLYQLSEATVFDGTNLIETGIALYDTDKTFSIAMSFDDAAVKPGQSMLYSCTDTNNQQSGSRLLFNNQYIYQGQGTSRTFNVPFEAEANHKIIILHEAGTFVYSGYRKKNDENPGTFSFNGSDPFQPASVQLTIGGRYSGGNVVDGWHGTVRNFTIYDHVLSQEEIDAYLGD